MKLLAIVGSPREGSNTSYLVDETLAEARKEGVSTEKIVLTDFRVNPCLAHDDCATFTVCKIEDDIPKIQEKFLTADGVLLASPVYFGNVTAQMKAFIDRCRFLRQKEKKLQARCIGLVAVAANTGTETTIEAMKRLFGRLSNVGPDEMLVLMGKARNAGEAKKDAALVAEARRLGKEMAQRMKKTASPTK